MFGKDDKKDGTEPKKSLFQRFQVRKKGGEISDADVAKYTGMSKEQLSDWAKDRPGVGGHQAAGKISVGPASGLGGMGAGEGGVRGLGIGGERRPEVSAEEAR
ncbi:hypothetical protein ACHAQH_007087 [Verticillium albo-atrum]